MTDPSERRRPAGRIRPGRAAPAVAALMAAALLVPACGGGDDGGSERKGPNRGVPANAVVASPAGADEGTPKRGGTITYGLEGGTASFCLPSSQLAVSGTMVAQAVYDTLTRPDSDGGFQPYLARSVEHNDTYDVWTIRLRDGVRFHDGTLLDAAAVKQNIDAWRKGILLQFVFQNVADTRVVDPQTVEVRTKIPWVAFPAMLFASGRTGVVAPAQLADEKTCDTNMIGTGPFRLKKFEPSTGAVDVVRNPDYWREGFPYLDGIGFRVQGDGAQRVSGLQSGQFDITHLAGGRDLDELGRKGDSVHMVLEPFGRMEISFMLLNVSKPPFDDPGLRRALAMGADRSILNRIANGTNPRWRVANQVFDTAVPGYLDDPGYPAFDTDEARRIVDEYREKHPDVKMEFSLQSTYDPGIQRLAKEVQRQAATFGVTVKLPPPVDQGTLIGKAITGGIDAFLFRNYAGEDPDTMWPWFHSGSPVNFNHIDDPVIDEALEEGRTNPDPAAREKAYETFNHRVSSQAYNIWAWYTQWFVAAKPSVHGIVGPALPDESGAVGRHRPLPMIAGYHQLLGLWVS